MSKKYTGKYNKTYCGKAIISKTNSNLPHHKPKRIRKKYSTIKEEFTLLDLIIRVIKELIDFL